MRKPQKLPWPCARSHCGVNVPPSGPLSGLEGVPGTGVKRHVELRDRDTEGAQSGRWGDGKEMEAWEEGTEKTATGRQRCGGKDRVTDGGTETETQMQRRTETGQGGGGRDSDGADCRRGGSRRKSPGRQ